jgi:hypothetical protein
MKITKEGWAKWLEKKSGPEMIYAVIMSLVANPQELMDSIFEYAAELERFRIVEIQGIRKRMESSLDTEHDHACSCCEDLEKLLEYYFEEKTL